MVCKNQILFVYFKVSHSNAYVKVIGYVDVLKVTSTVVFVGLQTFAMGEECTVSLSLFAGPERILRRFSVFAEEPRKSIITTTELCNPVFKEVQPKPS